MAYRRHHIRLAIARYVYDEILRARRSVRVPVRREGNAPKPREQRKNRVSPCNHHNSFFLRMMLRFFIHHHWL